MNFHQMYCIRTIAKEGSINKAAQKLFIAQPSLSRQLKTLEEELGYTIFDRSTNPLTLTQYGRQIIPFIDMVLGEKRQLEKRLLELSNSTAGEVRIVTTSNFGLYFLPQVLSNFQNAHPNITVTLKEFDNISLLEESLKSGQFDLGCLTMAPTTDNITFEPVLRIETFLAIPPAFLGNEQVLTLDLLREIPYILMRENFRLRRNAEAFFAYYDFTPHTIQETSSLNLAYSLSGVGMGATFVHSPAVAFSNVKTPPILYHLQPHPLYNEIGFSCRTGLHEDKAAALFKSFARTVMKDTLADMEAPIQVRSFLC